MEQSCYIGEDEDFWRNVYTIQSATVVTFENVRVRPNPTDVLIHKSLNHQNVCPDSQFSVSQVSFIVMGLEHSESII